MKYIAATIIILSALIGIKTAGNHQAGNVTYKLTNPNAPKILAVQEAYAEAPKPTPIPVEPLLNYIHMAESTNGTNRTPGSLHAYCKSIGKTNEYGYGGMAMKICFNTEKEARETVEKWLTDHLKQYNDVAKTLCHYNLGSEEINCKYYQKYIGGEI